MPQNESFSINVLYYNTLSINYIYAEITPVFRVQKKLRQTWLKSENILTRNDFRFVDGACIEAISGKKKTALRQSFKIFKIR
jgi:hypothetical protein